MTGSLIPQLSLANAVLLIGAAQGVFMVLLLLTVDNANRQANVYLALLLSVLSLMLVTEFMAMTRYFLVYPHLVNIDAPTIFLYGPFIYFYTRAMTAPVKTSFTYKQFWHFLPSVMLALLVLPFYALDADAKAAWAMEHILRHRSAGIFGWLAFVHIVLYCVISYIAVITHRRRMPQQFSSLERVSLTWLRNLLVTLLLLTLAWGVAWLLPFSQDNVERLNYWVHLLIVAAIYAFGFWGVRQARIFRQSDVAGSPTVGASPGGTSDKYMRGLDLQSSELIYREAQRVMESALLYKNNELSLNDLATHLGLSTHAVSQAINQQSGSNFFDFVNGYRVREARRILMDAAQTDRSVTDIALDAGFNSKSAFYTAFKRGTGVTPTQFRQQLPSLDKRTDPH